MPISLASASAFNALLNAVKTAWPTLHAWIVTQSAGADPATRERLLRALRWTAGADAQLAFAEAVGQAIESYQAAETGRRAPTRVARALADVAASPLHPSDTQAVLLPAFDPEADLSALRAKVVARILGKHRLRSETVKDELHRFYDGHLRPAVAGHPYFAERTLLAEIARTLRDIRAGVLTPLSETDLEDLERHYLTREAEHSRYMTTRGLSLRLKNEFLRVELRDVFVPVEFDVEPERSTWSKTVRVLQKTSNPFRIDSPVKFWGGGNPTPFGRRVLSSLGQIRTPLVSPLPLRFSHLPMSEDQEWLTRFDDGRIHWYGGGDPFLPDVTTESAAALLSRRAVVIQGDPGSGKSTFAQFVHHAAASHDVEAVGEGAAAAVPVRVRAVALGDALTATPGLPFETFLADSETAYAPALQRALLSGRALVLIDGLDEVADPALRYNVREAIERFLADPLFADTRVVLTTRVVGYQRDGQIGALPHATVRPFSDAQIGACVRAWADAFRDAQPTLDAAAHAQELVEAIHSSDGVLRLARNPLLLTIIVLLHWQGRTLPSNRAHLYDVAVGTLLSTWPAAQRGIELDEHFLREWLAPVARRLFTEGDAAVVAEAELKDLLISTMLGLKTVTPVEARTETDRLLRIVEEHTGLLVPQGLDADGRSLYGFSHQTFVEYLTAADLAEDLGDADFDIAPFARDPYWREALLLLAGQLGNVSRRRAGVLVSRLRAVDRASPTDGLLRTGTLRALGVLADGVPIAPPELVVELCQVAVALTLRSPLSALREAVRPLLRDLAQTEYAGALAREARDQARDPGDIVRLAHATSPTLFESELDAVLALRPGDDGAPELPSHLDSLHDHAHALLIDLRPGSASALRQSVRSGPLGRRIFALDELSARDPQGTRDLVADTLESAPDDALVPLWLVFKEAHPDLVAARLLAALPSGHPDHDETAWLVRQRDHLPQADRPPLARIVRALESRPTALGWVGTTVLGDDVTVTPDELDALVEHPDRDLQRAVSIAYLRLEIDRHTDSDATAWELTHQALNDGTPAEQLAAADILAGPDLGGVQEALDPILKNGEPLAQTIAARYYPPGDRAANHALWSALDDPETSFWAAGQIFSRGEDDEVERLTSALRARVPDVHSADATRQKLAATALLTWIESGDPDALDALTTALADAVGSDDAKLPLVVAEVLSMQNLPDVALLLASFLDDSPLGLALIRAFERSGNRDAQWVLVDHADRLLGLLDEANTGHQPALNALYRALSPDAVTP